MSHYGWDNCPKEVKLQVNHFVDALHLILGDNLTGIYIHGSLAMNCFNPQSSDIDVLVATQQPVSPEARWALAKLLLSLSNSPRPLEVSFLHLKQLASWQHPTPFDLHYSEDWRERYENCLAQHLWDLWPEGDNLDGDLSAHFTIIQQRGICLWGQPIPQTFPGVPAQDYLDSIVSDGLWAIKRIAENPVYAVLNTCRVFAYVQAGLICSKEEGGVWAVAHLPPELQEPVLTALAAYRGDGVSQFNSHQLDQYAKYMVEHLGKI